MDESRCTLLRDRLELTPDNKYPDFVSDKLNSKFNRYVINRVVMALEKLLKQNETQVENFSQVRDILVQEHLCNMAQVINMYYYEMIDALNITMDDLQYLTDKKIINKLKAFLILLPTSMKCI
jgi:hypothetical protein